ncbi:MAG: hypothetical protein QOK24_1112 [Verrucomicrobiota bacterium]|jgi:hypothetical protein
MNSPKSADNVKAILHRYGFAFGLVLLVLFRLWVVFILLIDRAIGIWRTRNGFASPVSTQ